MSDWGEGNEWGGAASFSDGEDEGGEAEEKQSLDHIICLVDARANMFETNANGQTYFAMAMKVIHRVLRTKIIQSDRNMVGVTLFGTANKTTADSPHDHVYDLVPIDVPNASGIRTVDRLEKTLLGAPASAASGSGNGGGMGSGTELSGPYSGSAGSGSGGYALDDSQEDDSFNDLSHPAGVTSSSGGGGGSGGGNIDEDAITSEMLARAAQEFFGGAMPSPSDATASSQKSSRSGPCPLKSALWSCTQAFIRTTGGSSNATKRIFLFTNDDAPLEGNSDEQDKVVQVARDAYESGVEIQLFGMARKSKGFVFDAASFYHRLLVVGEDDAAPEDKVLGASDFDHLAASIHRKIHQKRTLARLPLVLSQPSSEANISSSGSGGGGDKGAAPSMPTVSIQMKLVITTAPTKIASVQLDGNVNQVVKAHTKSLCEASGAYLDEYDVRTYHEVGGHNERAYVTKAEMAAMKQWGEPGIVMLGFVNKEWLKPWYMVRSPYFLYPDESTVKGSTAAAAALLDACLAKEVVGVARFVRTSNSSPQLLALVPQAEELSGEDGSQLSPPGFHALVLPFADDLRDLPAEPATATTTTATTATEGAAETSSTVNQTVSEAPQLAAAAEALVGAVTLEREAVMSIHNPVLQKQYHMLQALALDEGVADSEWQEDRDDDCRPPPYAWLAAQPLVEHFLQQLPADAEKGKGGKRKAPGESASAAKKTKAAAGGDGGTAIDWAAIAEAGAVQKQTVDTLKQFCRDRGLTTTGKKSDLVARVLDALGSA